MAAVAPRSLFRSGFSEFRHTGALSDVEVIVEGVRYRLHRLILSFSSEFFATIFKSEFKENATREVHIKFPDPKNVFPVVVKYMYGARISITAQNAIAILQQTEQLLIPSLALLCRAFIKKHLNSNTAFDLLLDAIEFNQESIVNWCLKILSASFLHHAEEFEWHKLEISTFLRLLRHERFSVSDEWQVYCVACDFVSAHADELSQHEVEDIMSTVRYRWLSFKQLQEVVSNETVPRALVIEALMGRLANYESGIVPKPSDIPPRLRKRPICGTLFEYAAPEAVLETASSSATLQPPAPGVLPHGIIYYIACTLGRTPWKNPVTSSVMTVASSSLERGALPKLLDEAPSELWTQNVPASYLCIDFMRYRVAPVSYALRHGHNHKRDYLRNWDFQGSNDGKIWTTLRRHSNDDSLNGPFDVKVFALLSPPTVPYQFFRIIQTGHNSSGNNFLVLCGFEVFGELWDVSSSDEIVATAQVNATFGPHAGLPVSTAQQAIQQTSPAPAQSNLSSSIS